MSTKTGGSAFPFQMQSSGMTLRDYFADSADVRESLHKLTENIANELGCPYPPDRATHLEWIEWNFRVLAKLQYMKADAMLAEREKLNG
jgi:hypothetical protein